MTREEAIDVLRHNYPSSCFEDLCKAVDIAIKALSAQPEIIRCKDCKYFIQSNEKCELIDTRLHFYETDKMWTDDCFCAWAERREDG